MVLPTDPFGTSPSASSAAASSSAAESSSVSSLRSLLASRGLPVRSQPDAESLQTMLMVAGGDAEAASRLILDSLGAERRISGETVGGDHRDEDDQEQQQQEEDRARLLPGSRALPPPAAGLGNSSRHMRSNATGGSGRPSTASVLFNTLLAWPLTLLQSLLALLANVLPLRSILPASFFGNATGGTGFRSTRLGAEMDPVKAAERYRAGLDAFIAANDSGHSADGEKGTTATSSSTAAAAGLGGTADGQLRHRTEEASASYPPRPSTSSKATLRLPPTLLTTSYNAAIAQAKETCRVLVIVLESLPHQHCDRFRREVLLHPQFAEVLEKRNMLLWGGEVGCRDAYQGEFSATSCNEG